MTVLVVKVRDERRLNVCLIDNIKGKKERRHHMKGNSGGRNIVVQKGARQNPPLLSERRGLAPDHYDGPDGCRHTYFL
jgi:hypothetical protein